METVMRASPRFLSPFAVALLVVVSCAAKVRERPRTSIEMETFDYAWRYVKDSVPEGQVDPVAWQKVYDELLPRAKAADSADELRPVLSDMLRSLGQSHYTVLSGDVNDALSEVLAQSPQAHTAGGGDPGVDVRLLDHRAIVTHVYAATPFQLGDAIVSIDGKAVAPWIARLEDGVDDPWLAGAYARYVVVQAMAAPPDKHVAVVVERGTDTRTLDVTTTPAEMVQGPGLAGPEPLHTEARMISPRVGYLLFDHFLVPVMERFVAGLTQLRGSGAEALVIDVRGNPGGLVLMVRGIGGYLIGDPNTSLGRMTTQAGTLELTANPPPPAQVFHGKVAVLVDELSASTAEVFAAGLQAIGRARVFGQPSAGRALPSTFISLPNGDILQVATGRLADPKGRELEGKGVAPDVVVPLDRAALATGRDPVIDAALRWIENEP
jgi:carboxyl-terminal processing protease